MKTYMCLNYYSNIKSKKNGFLHVTSIALYPNPKSEARPGQAIVRPDPTRPDPTHRGGEYNCNYLVMASNLASV